ncbi:hypothetical protein DQF64_10145 [Moraxella bovis]|nr:hypothetical protein DQF64_10145 [Moraxella bovis]
MVVFAGECELKSHFPDNVCYLYEFTDYILSFDEIVFSEDEIQYLINILNLTKLENNNDNKKSHLKQLREKH